MHVDPHLFQILRLNGFLANQFNIKLIRKQQDRLCIFARNLKAIITIFQQNLEPIEFLTELIISRGFCYITKVIFTWTEILTNLNCEFFIWENRLLSITSYKFWLRIIKAWNWYWPLISIISGRLKSHMERENICRVERSNTITNQHFAIQKINWLTALFIFTDVSISQKINWSRAVYQKTSYFILNLNESNYHFTIEKDNWVSYGIIEINSYLIFLNLWHVN